MESPAAEIDTSLGYMVPSGEVFLRIAGRKMYRYRDITISACTDSHESRAGCKQFTDRFPIPETV